VVWLSLAGPAASGKAAGSARRLAGLQGVAASQPHRQHQALPVADWPRLDCYGPCLAQFFLQF